MCRKYGLLLDVRQSLQQQVQHRSNLLHLTSLFVRNKEGTKSTNAATIVGVVLVIILITVIVGIIFYMRRSIVRPIELLNQSIQQVAAGDLSTEDVAVRSKDEIGTLSTAFNAQWGFRRAL